MGRGWTAGCYRLIRERPRIKTDRPCSGFGTELGDHFQTAGATAVRTLFRASLTVTFCLAAAAAGALVLADPAGRSAIGQGPPVGRATLPRFQQPQGLRHLPDELRRSSSFPLFSSGGFRDRRVLGGMPVHGPIADRGSIDRPRRQPSRSGPARHRRSERAAPLDPAESPNSPFIVFQIHATIGLLSMYEGKFDEAAAWNRRTRGEQRHWRPAGPAGQLRGDAGGDPPAARRNGKLPGVPAARRAASSRSRPRPCTSGRRARARRSAISASTSISAPRIWACAGS